MTPIFADLFFFRDHYNQESACYLSVYQEDSYAVCIASQIWGHSGINIRYAPERIANAVRSWYSFDPEMLVYVEHQPAYRELLSGISFFDDSFNRYRFRVGKTGNYFSPRFQIISRNTVEEMIAQPLSAFDNALLLEAIGASPSPQSTGFEHLCKIFKATVRDWVI